MDFHGFYQLISSMMIEKGSSQINRYKFNLCFAKYAGCDQNFKNTLLKDKLRAFFPEVDFRFSTNNFSIGPKCMGENLKNIFFLVRRGHLALILVHLCIFLFLACKYSGLIGQFPIFYGQIEEIFSERKSISFGVCFFLNQPCIVSDNFNQRKEWTIIKDQYELRSIKKWKTWICEKPTNHSSTRIHR